MLTIDTHCHAGRDRMEPVEVLLFQMDRNGVDRAILVQFTTEFDNRYLLECARAHEGRFAVIGSVDVARPDAVHALERWAGAGVQGLRLRLADLPGAADLPALLRSAARLGLKLSCYGTADEFLSPAFGAVVAREPSLPVIVEHLGSVRFTEAGRSTFERVLGLARHPNLHLKLHGLGEHAPRPFDPAVVRRCVDRAIDAFGADRMMIGTDWPPCASREGYANVLRGLRENLTRRSPAERAAVLGGTAAALFAF